MSFGLLAVMIIGVLVLPVPTLLIDIFIAFNLAAAVGLMVYALYIDKPTAFSTFPGLLLFTTLFRIALNVATARQILLTGYAGQIIETVGMNMVGGNVVVGLVVFTIIAIVQFVVVAKGAERVAEVAARFTLDALPGRQVSIDSDLRAGVITQMEAKHMRAQLSAESQLFGAMDGAMKFVKGDVIAGMIVVVINLVGGIAIGVLMLDMNTSDAVHKYSIMSIGDGLVSQIPALFAAVAAGVMVTRVEKDGAENVAGQIGQQVASQPKALILTGAVTTLFAVVPGFPFLVFAPMGLAMLLGARHIMRKTQLKAQELETARSQALSRSGAKRDVALFERGNPATALPVVILLSEGLAVRMDRHRLNAALAKGRESLADEYGIPFPGMMIRIALFLTEADQARVLVNDVPYADRRVPANKVLAVAPQAVLKAAGADLPDTQANFFLTREAYWIEPDALANTADVPVTTMNAEEALASLAMEALKANPKDWFGVQETQALIAACEENAPDLSRELLAVVPLTKLTEVLRTLLAEGLPLRDIRSIFQSLLRAAQRPHDETALVTAARLGLNKYISFRYSAGSGSINALVLDPALEELVHSSIKHTDAGPLLTLSPEETRRIQQSLTNSAIVWRKQNNAQIVVLVEARIRAQIKKLLDMQSPWLPVLSHEEVIHGVSIKTVSSLGKN
ncbi:MAG: FHIPEP family type III secretion protein [Burkholderiaceae bacterium]